MLHTPAHGEAQRRLLARLCDIALAWYARTADIAKARPPLEGTRNEIADTRLALQRLPEVTQVSRENRPGPRSRSLRRSRAATPTAAHWKRSAQDRRGSLARRKLSHQLRTDNNTKSTAAHGSIAASARLHNIEPEEYLRSVFGSYRGGRSDHMLDHGLLLLDTDGRSTRTRRARRQVRPRRNLRRAAPHDPGRVTC